MLGLKSCPGARLSGCGWRGAYDVGEVTRSGPMVWPGTTWPGEYECCELTEVERWGNIGCGPLLFSEGGSMEVKDFHGLKAVLKHAKPDIHRRVCQRLCGCL